MFSQLGVLSPSPTAATRLHDSLEKVFLRNNTKQNGLLRKLIRNVKFRRIFVYTLAQTDTTKIWFIFTLYYNFILFYICPFLIFTFQFVQVITLAGHEDWVRCLSFQKTGKTFFIPLKIRKLLRASKIKQTAF